MRVIFNLCSIVSKGGYKFMVMPFKKAMLKQCGKNVLIGRGADLTYHNISIGNDVVSGKIKYSKNGHIKYSNFGH
jgi:hypothetical protein